MVRLAAALSLLLCPLTVPASDAIAASDFLGNGAVNHLDPATRGLEAGDSVTISGAQQILFDVFASTPGDYARVLTLGSSATPVPEPRSIAVLGFGLIALAARRIKRRDAAFSRRAAA